MKKFTFFFALFAMFFLNVGLAKGETATIAYSTETTTNMTGGNDAALVGLDASMWSVVSNKGGASNHVGLNKAGNIRLYAHKDSGNGNILTVSISQGTIEEITLNIKQTAKYTVKAAEIEVTATEGDTYAIGANTFSIQNITTGESTQLHLNSITITYTSTGEGGGDTPDTPDAPDTPVTGTEITGIQGADATYVADEEFGDYWVFNLYASIDEAEGMYMSPYLYVETYEVYGKTTLNGTYNIYYAEYWKNENEEDLVNTDEMAEEPVGTLTIKNKDNNGNYSFVGSFVGLDGKTYTLNQVVPVTAYEYLGQDEDGYDIYEDLTLSENGSTPDTPDTPDTPNTPDTPVAGAVTFDADVDKGNASEDSSNQTPYTVSKGGVTLDVTKGIIGKYNEECHYRVYQNETLTLTSTVGNIVSVEFTCTANGEEKYGPGNFTVDSGSYTYSGPVGTWTGDAASVVFTASTAQVRASQIVVKIAGGTTGVEDVTTIEIPVKVLKNGQVMILNGENVYNVLGAQVK